MCLHPYLLCLPGKVAGNKNYSISVLFLVCLHSPGISGHSQNMAVSTWISEHDTGLPPYWKKDPTDFCYGESGHSSFQRWPGMHKEGSEPSVDVRTQGKDRHEQTTLELQWPSPCWEDCLLSWSWTALKQGHLGQSSTDGRECHSVLEVRPEVAVEDVY